MENAPIRLKLKEMIFLQQCFAGKNQTDAYIVVNPKTSRKNAAYNGWRYMKRITEKLGGWKEFLEFRDIGDWRLALEIDRGLNATKVKIYRGHLIKDDENNVIHFEDNATRQRTRELLARILGKDKPDFGLLPGTEIVIRYQAIEPKPIDPPKENESAKNGADQ